LTLVLTFNPLATVWLWFTQRPLDLVLNIERRSRILGFEGADCRSICTGENERRNYLRDGKYFVRKKPG
jgi:hypothetical protein